MPGVLAGLIMSARYWGVVMHLLVTVRGRAVLVPMHVGGAAIVGMTVCGRVLPVPMHVGGTAIVGMTVWGHRAGVDGGVPTAAVLLDSLGRSSAVVA